MADEVSLALSPKRKVQNPETQNIGKPDATLDMIDSLKDSMHLTLSEEDPKFAAVAISNNAGKVLLPKQKKNDLRQRLLQPRCWMTKFCHPWKAY